MKQRPDKKSNDLSQVERFLVQFPPGVKTYLSGVPLFVLRMSQITVSVAGVKCLCGGRKMSPHATPKVQLYHHMPMTFGSI